EDRDAFFVADLGDVVKKHIRFLKALPRVKPFYAVKCNSSKGVVQTLAELGAGFDCASKKADAENFITNRMVLRIATDDSKSSGRLSVKFGAPLKSCRRLLEMAKNLNVDVIGVSFHVGSGCCDSKAYVQSISDARLVFEMASEFGYKMWLLDIGGGFPGTDDAKVRFEEIAAVINPALDLYFPEGSAVEIIAEPGRYYVASAFSLAVNVIAKKVVQLDNCGSDVQLLKKGLYKVEEKETVCTPMSCGWEISDSLCFTPAFAQPSI
ncbi:hypothetical protein AB205_0056470, partial [Aquarana catesbeiana]